MLESQSSIEQSRRNSISLLLQNLPSSSTMSTECESAVPQSLGTQSLHHASSLPSSSIMNENHPLSGISYEGRLSLISPYANYQQTLRTSLGMPSTQPSTPTLSSPFLSTSQFPNSQMAGLMNSDRINSYFLGEEHRRNLYGGRPLVNPSSSSSSSQDIFHESQLDSLSNNTRPIKQEPSADSYDEPGTSKLQNNEQNGNYYDPIDMLHSSRQENTLESTPDPKKFKTAPVESPDDDESQKELISTPTRMQFEGLEDDLYMNGDNGSRHSSPFEVQGNEELEPTSMDSDPEDTHEHGAAMSLMEQSFEECSAGLDHGENSMPLKCTFCSYSTDSQFSYNSHINTHFDHKCTKCDYTTQTICQLKVHSQEDHGMTVEEVEELESIRVPKINAQGKIKKFNCKQCGYVAITKSDFWRHARSHIKSEKLLTCKKCPFVTEYKHHLEYHLRNHVGIKPFQCNKCTYSCVNKSMLNSHMKSHSNVYQYRCSNCTYATKYCHSLKLHLRKYGHSPAMVLNPDGSPNPVPIIDVYGTRRGPKLKKDDNGMPILPPHYQYQAQMIKAQMEVTGTLPPAPTAPQEKISQSKQGGRQLGMQFPVSSLLASNPFSLPANFQSYPSFIPQEFRPMKDQVVQISECREQLKDSENKTAECLNVSKSPEVKEEPLKCESCDFSTPSKDVLTHHNLLHKNNIDSERRKQCPSSPLNLGKVPTSGVTKQLEGNMALASQAYNHMTGLAHSSLLHPTVMQSNFQDYLARALMLQGLQNQSVFDMHPQFQRRPYISHPDTDIIRNERFPKSPSPTKSIETTPTQTELALDLSKEQTPPNRIPAVHQSLFATHSVATASTSSPSSSDVSTPPAKNRRKGRAYKLERIALRLSGSGEEGESSSHDGDDGPKDIESPPTKSYPMPPLVPLEEEKKDSPTEDSKWKEAFNCQYCDIAFKDIVLYTMHMGYHGYKDAFTCNSCGFKAEDKINFSLHIARAAHN